MQRLLKTKKLSFKKIHNLKVRLHLFALLLAGQNCLPFNPSVALGKPHLDPFCLFGFGFFPSNGNDPLHFTGRILMGLLVNWPDQPTIQRCL